MKTLNTKLLEMDDKLYNEWFKALDEEDYVTSETIAAIRVGLRYAMSVNNGIEDDTCIMEEIRIARQSQG